ncbi:hypothetical protein TURU_153189 [Turdus rufiventris]|nr:hypothetical protein TURU_153189 [Turdus rufiventris]
MLAVSFGCTSVGIESLKPGAAQDTEVALTRGEAKAFQQVPGAHYPSVPMGMDVCSSQALFSPDLHTEDAGMAPQDNPGQAGHRIAPAGEMGRFGSLESKIFLSHMDNCSWRDNPDPGVELLDQIPSPPQWREGKKVGDEETFLCR